MKSCDIVRAEMWLLGRGIIFLKVKFHLGVAVVAIVAAVGTASYINWDHVVSQ